MWMIIQEGYERNNEQDVEDIETRRRNECADKFYYAK